MYIWTPFNKQSSLSRNSFTDRLKANFVLSLNISRPLVQKSKFMLSSQSSLFKLDAAGFALPKSVELQ